MNLDWKANWIWDSGEAQPRNYRLNVRKVFECQSELREAIIHISADSRYRLYLNGIWIGDGPARSFPHLQQFDSYDIKPYLSKGKNIVAVTVNHYGESTFQYLLGRGGLLCQIELEYTDGSCDIIPSDSAWQVRKNEAYEQRSPRISCQMPFEENYDARRIDPNWINVDFDDSGWENAKVIGLVGADPWKQMRPRTIPFLSRAPYHPSRLIASRYVKPAALVETVNIRPYLLPGIKDANHQNYRGLIATEIVSSEDQTVELPRQWSIRLGEWRLNGEPINPLPDRNGVEVKLNKGVNLFIADLVGRHHYIDFTLAIDAELPLKIRAPFDGDGKWLIVGPLADDYKEAKQIMRGIRTKQDLIKFEEKFHFSSVKSESAADVWNLTFSQKTAPGAPKIERIESMFVDNAEYAIVHPSENGVEILLDFGQELVGFTEFEVDAPAGVVMDFNCFEAINDGVIQWTRGNRSSFRYVTRQGLQHFVTDWRRGFRYAALTFRNISEPIKIRYIRTLMSTYPAVERGDFQCSDERLNRIWKVGRHTLLCCMEDVFTDCPTYEQTYWVGDGRNEALISYAAYGEWPLTARCVKLPPQSLFRSKLPESQVPSGWQNILTAWSLLWVQMAHEYYLHSGDIETLKEVYPGVAQTMRACQGMTDNDYGLMKVDAWNMFDWAGVDDDHQLVAHNNMFLLAALDRTIEMARVLGRVEDIPEWQDFAKQIKTNINKYLWSEELGGYIDSIHDDGTPSKVVSQQANTLALLYDVAPPERAAQIVSYTTNPPEGMITFGSPFAMFYLLEELAKEKRFGDILDIIRDRWGFMIDTGATTFWETFPGFQKDIPTRSHCHAWSAAPTYFLSRYQLGVEPLEPGYTKALIAPHPANLTWCKGRMPTPHGEISVYWQRSDDKFIFKAELPQGASAKIILPVNANVFKTVEINGRSVDEGLPDGVFSVSTENGKWVIEVGAGRKVIIHSNPL